MNKNRELPALDLLKGFEASARHLSFTRAAVDLHLTQSAVSRQVQALESQLGVKLFTRHTRSLQLTDAGEHYRASIGKALQLLREATMQIRALKPSNDLAVTTSVTIASLWLVPRLPAFQRQHPRISVHVVSDNEYRDLKSDKLDVAIRYGTRKQAGKNAQFLFGERLVPVCSPALLAGAATGNPPDLNRFALLHFEDPQGRVSWVSWNKWFRAVKVPAIQGAGAVRFSFYDQMIAAAVNGQGVALGRLPLIEPLIRSGKLVVPLTGRRYLVALPSHAYWLVTSPHSKARTAAGQFARWLLAQASDGDSPFRAG